MCGARVNGTEVTLDAADFLLKDLVPEPRLELSLPERGCRDAHCILATTKKNLRGCQLKNLRLWMVIRRT